MRTRFPNISGYVLIQERIIFVIFIIGIIIIVIISVIIMVIIILIVIVIIIAIIVIIINTPRKRKEVGFVFKTISHCSQAEEGIGDRTVETLYVLHITFIY